MRRSILVFTAVFLLMIPSGMAVWTLNDIDDPYSWSNVSRDMNTIQIVEVKDSNGDPIENKSELKSLSGELKYIHDGNEKSMKPLEDGFWYGSLTPTEDINSVEYELLDNSPSGGEINVTENITTGNMDVEILTDFSERMRAGADKEVEVEVTGNNDVEDNADVNLYFVNSRDNFKRVGLGFRDETYRQKVSIPRHYGKFAVHAVAKNSDASYDKAYGSSSTLLKTYPETVGVTALNTTGLGCNLKSMMTACERGAEINVAFNGSVHAEDVDLNLMLVDSGGDTEKFKFREMERSGSIWKTDFVYPDINSSYRKEVLLKFNVDLGSHSVNVTRNISSQYFAIEDESAPQVVQGNTYTIDLAFVKYFSREALTESRIENIDVTVLDPNGDVFESFGMDSMEFISEEGLFRNQIDIPLNAESGGYQLEISARNIHEERKSIKSDFMVKSVSEQCGEEGVVLCIKPPVKWINVTADRRDEYIREFNISYTGDAGPVEVRTSRYGDAASYMDVQPSTFSLNDEKRIKLNYSVWRRGNFTGSVRFSTDEASTELNTKLSANVERQEPGISVSPTELSLDQVENGNATAQIQVENTGDVPLDISATSFEYDLSYDDLTVSEGRTSTLDLKISGIEASSGSITIRGDSKRRSVSETVSVSATLSPSGTGSGDYEQRISELNTRIDNLQSRAVSTSMNTRLEDIRSRVSNLRSLYERGSTTEAESEYRSIQAELDSIEQSIETSSSNTGSTGSEEESPRPGSSPNDGTSEQTPDDTNNSGGGGGFAIMLILVIMLLGVIGFVVYTSVYPEEGDPLYEVLGDKDDNEF